MPRGDREVRYPLQFLYSPFIRISGIGSILKVIPTPEF